MKTTISFIILLLCLIISSHAQLKVHDNLLGPTLGFWSHNSSPTFGGNYEYQVTQAGIGTIGLGALARFSSYNYGNDNFPTKYSNLFLGGQGNYNFNQIGNGSFVPFLGLVLGFYSASHSSINESGLWLFGQAGARYFFNPNIAGVVRFGLGNFNFNALELGVDFRF